MTDKVDRRRGPRPSIHAERNAEIERLRLEDGWTLERIGQRFNVKRERVRQILEDRGADDALRAKAVRNTRKQDTATHVIESFDARTGPLIERLLLAEVPAGEISRRLPTLGHDITEKDVELYASRHRLPVPRPIAPRFSAAILRLAVLAAAVDVGQIEAKPDDAALVESEALDALLAVSTGPAEVVALASRAATARAADEPLSISKSAYEDWRLGWLRSFPKHDPLPWPPTAQTVMKRLGRGYWNEAVRDAGLANNDRGRPRGPVVYKGVDEYEGAMSEFLEASARDGRPVSVVEYDRWSIGRVVPTSAAVRGYFGGWNSAKLAGAAVAGAPATRLANKRVIPADQLVDRILLQLDREWQDAVLDVPLEGHPKAIDLKLKELTSELIGQLVTDFESFRRRWLFEAIKENPSVFVARLSSGEATKAERRTWAALGQDDPRGAVEFVITGRSLDDLLKATDGDLTDSGGWLAGAQQMRLAGIARSDSLEYRVLKAARNVLMHDSDDPTVLRSALDALRDEESVLTAGRTIPGSPASVRRWLVTTVVPPSGYGQARLARSRVAHLHALLVRVANTMRSTPT